MKIYLMAMVDAGLLTVTIGTILVAIVYSILVTLHASHNVEIFGLGLALLAFLVTFVIVFRLMVKRERELSIEGV